jgi:hypothetical protein
VVESFTAVESENTERAAMTGPLPKSKNKAHAKTLRRKKCAKAKPVEIFSLRGFCGFAALRE